MRLQALYSIFFIFCVSSIHQNVLSAAHHYPIVYHLEYNISCGGFTGWLLQKLHPFDGTKYRRIAKQIASTCNMDIQTQWHRPNPVTTAQKLLVHTQEYLNSLNSSATISEALDCGKLLSWVPNSFLKNLALRPMEYATGGTILAVQLALEHGWAINLSGGYHHAATNRGEGGCIFSDVPIALHVLWQNNPNINVLIIDLDAHQGNGFEQVLQYEPRVVYFDMFNPHAGHTNNDLMRRPNVVAELLEGGRLSSTVCGITFPDLLVERCVGRKINDAEYFERLTAGLERAFNRCKERFGKAPDLIVYNAGSDINSNDPWGCMNVSEAGIIARDAHIFAEATAHKIPICMVLSGSYFPRSAEVISTSIAQIIESAKTFPATLNPRKIKQQEREPYLTR